MKLLFSKYKLIIFDWDGTLVDSLESYKAWDKLYVSKFYGIELPLSYFEKLAIELKEITPGVLESKYFRYLDKTYGDGKTPAEEIWNNVYSIASEVQRDILYRENAVRVLELLRSQTSAVLALATNAELKDIRYFSSSDSRTAAELSPLSFFDTIVTSDDVAYPKPHPETFNKVIQTHDVHPSEVLIFEDSTKGVAAARRSGADVIAIHADVDARAQAHLSFDSWSDILSALEANL